MTNQQRFSVKTIGVCALRIIIILLIALFTSGCEEKDVGITEDLGTDAQYIERIPTFIEIQELLVCKGYDIKVDGIIGANTLKVWEKAICQQYEDGEYTTKAYWHPIEARLEK